MCEVFKRSLRLGSDIAGLRKCGENQTVKWRGLLLPPEVFLKGAASISRAREGFFLSFAQFVEFSRPAIVLQGSSDTPHLRVHFSFPQVIVEISKQLK